MNKFLIPLNIFFILACSQERSPGGFDGFYENRYLANGFTVTEKGYSSISFEVGSDSAIKLSYPNFFDFIRPDLEIKDGKLDFYTFYDSQFVRSSETYLPGSEVNNTYSTNGDSIVFKYSGFFIVKVANVQHETLCPSGAEIRVSDAKYLNWSYSSTAGCENGFIDTVNKHELNYRDSLHFRNTTSKFKILDGTILIKKIMIEERYQSDSIQRIVYPFNLVENRDNILKYGSWSGLDSIRLFSLESIWKK